MIKKEIIKNIKKRCSICGTNIKVVLYPDKSYEGGHYFGAVEKAEYWECDKCYFDGKQPKL